ncbi:alpha-galactosidase [Paenibacillus sp. J53TS2]|uniref:alpha-galactosidase n=1 Tax=Paenibacillus sp. J53TS2 TaxID=2807197 RepID=UPI001B155C44|nr:alpha-galactosidase [Paenibacillus sp. J53TS2]GIP49278.1 alpha-galactosidase [Paenibacillus sp. J53TS2]
MAIRVYEEQGIFHLQSKGTSYIMQIVNGYPAHVYWGKQLAFEEQPHSFVDLPEGPLFLLDRLPQEYPQYGTGDFRSPAYQVRLGDGSRITELVYSAYRILKGKPQLEGLPAVYCETENEGETLELELRDAYSGLIVTLSYSVFEDSAAIARSVRIDNQGEQPLQLLRALSASIDMPRSDLDAVYLAGTWNREAHVQRRPLGPGGTTIESRRGASGHLLNPFLALAAPDADEDHGDVFGFSFVYSGNFFISAEVEPFRTTRVGIGINPFDFSWQLAPGEAFQTPEAVMVYSGAGFGEMSRTYHRLYRTRLCRGVHRDRVRPILVNNWEATYFSFTEEKIEEIAKAGAELGIELFVLDDGWFGRREDDHSSLGDWTPNPSKLPGGLTNLAKRVNDLGVQFGLWFEPEMISPDSDLYRSHPDWCLHVEGRRRTEFRWQLILDYSRQDVRDYIYDKLSEIFSTVPISYVKWDMNRNMTEIGSATAGPEQQAEIAHRYMLGLYELLERLTTRFPNILFESCASGGGRFDPGMLYYMPQTWTSDDTDAVERLKIQYGTSFVYPVSAMGAHVSAVPNHQVGRVTSLQMRGDVAMSGNFGYEMDLTRFSDEEKDLAKAQIKRYKEIRSLVQQGDMYRLVSPFAGHEAAWMFVSEDRSEALAYYFKVLAEPNAPQRKLRLKGLDPDKLYKVEESGLVMRGDRLMAIGIGIPAELKDYYSYSVRLKIID